jgi:hypothetical protein
MGIDSLGASILSNYLPLDSPLARDVVATWDDTDLARRWLLLCPRRKNDDADEDWVLVIEMRSKSTPP